MSERPKRKVCWEETIEERNGNADVTPPPVLRELNPAHLNDPNKILHMLFDLFQEYSSIFSSKNSMADELQRFSSADNVTGSEQDTKKKRKMIKVSKKRARAEQILPEETGILEECTNKKFCSSIEKQWMQMPEQVIGRKNQITIFTQTDRCSCPVGRQCYPDSDCGYQCCNYLAQSDGSCAATVVCQKGSTTLVEDWRVANQAAAIQTVVQQEEKLRNQLAEQLDKCREILNVDGELGGSMEEPCSLLRKQLLNRGEPVADLERDNDSDCNVKCPSDCQDAANSSSDVFPLLIADGQGLVEMHIVCIQLSTSAPHVLFRESNTSNISVFLSWQMWDQEPAFTPTLKCPKLNFNSSVVYRIPNLFKFFHCVLSEYVAFHVNVVERDETSYAVARAKLCIKDILDYPQNKLHYITPVNSIDPCSLGMNFGQLSLWVRLSCDMEKVEAFKKQCGISSPIDDVQPPAKAKVKDSSESNQELRILKEHSKDPILGASDDKLEIHTIDSVPTPGVPTDESITTGSGHMSQFQSDPSPASLDNRNDQVMTSAGSRSFDMDEDTSEEESAQLKLEHAMKTGSFGEGDAQDSEMQAETASMKEFNALLADHNELSRGSTSTISDMNEVLSNVKWDEYRRRSRIHSGANRAEPQGESLDDQIGSAREFPLEKDTIVIEVVNVTLFRQSAVMSDDEVRLIYVEYSFLGHRGADMETHSVEKPTTSSEKITYNFKKQFSIDEKSHPVERNTLRAMLEESINPNIKFVLVSEPLPEETDIKECVEIGVAFFNIREYALGDGYKNVPLPLMNPEQTQQIGILKLFVLGLDAIRQCLGEDI